MRRLRPTWMAALLWLATGSAFADLAPLPPSTQHYELSASLDPEKHAVAGRMKLTVLNTSARPLTELWFHLYLNAFRSRTSVFMRESGGSMRGEPYRGPGSIDLASLRVDGSDALKHAHRELVPGDLTQLVVTLTKPVPPGATVTIESEFTARLPPLFARSGYEKQFVAVAQWFPKLAKLEPDGHFASFPYHARGEFYADFADYSLELETPNGYVVGATGQLASQTTRGQRLVRRYEAEHVVDAAFVASPLLVQRVQRVGDVQVTFLIPPGYERALPEHVEIVTAGLAHFGARFGPYPYRTLTVVLPPRGASGASGMEYPTLIVTGGAWLPTPGTPSASGAAITAHELAHQWFYAVLASNEMRYPVLDEGLAEWAALDLLRTRFGPQAAFSRYLPLDRFELERMAANACTAVAPGLAAYAYAEAEYGASVYARAAVVLESIRRAHGRARFDEALHEYALAQRFGHPTPDDLGRSFDAAYGAGFAERTLLPLLLRGESSAVHLAEVSEGVEGTRMRTHVRARRTGGVALPTWVAAYDAGGRELERVHWPADTPSLDITFEAQARVSRVVVDPDRALLVDPDVRDHIVWLAHTPPASLTARLLGLAQLVLGWVGP